MKIETLVKLLLLLGFLLTSLAKTHSQTTNFQASVKMETIQVKKSDTLEQILIDKIVVPGTSKQEFIERMNINRNFIKRLPGFVGDAAYEQSDGQGNLVYVTVAVWQNEDALTNAKEAVQAEYKKENFNMPEMLKRLNITIDRGIYKKVVN
jgi:heme-degrading monooxygenase HmoA